MFDRLTAELRQIFGDVDPAPSSVLEAGHAAILERDGDAELLETVFDSDDLTSVAANHRNRLVAFAGPLTILALHVEHAEPLSTMTGFVDGADPAELGLRRPREAHEVLGEVADGRVAATADLGGPVKLSLRAPHGGWRSSTDWFNFRRRG